MKRARSRSPSPKSKTWPLPSLADWSLVESSVLALPPSPALMRRAVVSTGKSSWLKLAAFDIDDTLIVPKNGAVFPHDDPTDWRWLLPTVPSHVRALHEEGFLVVLFSNQLGIGGKGWNETKADAIKRKILAMSEALRVPLAAYLATREDVWRKPNVGMWSLLQRAFGSEMDTAAPGGCFYVGDAAGRKIPTLAGRKKDFSCSDRKFALNIGIPFLTPEEFYKCPVEALLERGSGQRVTLLARDLIQSAETTPSGVDWGGVGPNTLRHLPNSYDALRIQRICADGDDNRTHTMSLQSPPVFHRTGQELVLFVGPPGSGKTTFFHRFFESVGYAHVSRDLLKTKERCVVEVRKVWREGRSVVVDNTNPAHSDCQLFIDAVKVLLPAEKKPLPIRIFVFQVPVELAMHMSNVRARLGVSQRIGRIAYNVFKSKYEPWTASAVRATGVEEVIEIPPVAVFDGLPKGTEREFFLLS